MSLAGAVHAFWVRDFAESTSYPLAGVNRFVVAGATVFLLYFGARAVDPAGQLGVEGGFFAWALVGWAVLQLTGAALSGYASRLRRHRSVGLLEACVMTRTPPWQLVLAMPAFELGRATLLTAAFGLGGLWIGEALPSLGGFGMALLHLVLGTACFAAIGVLSAASTLVLRAGDPVGRAVQLVGLLLSGVFVPREVFPPALQALGQIVPMAPMLDGIRGGLFVPGYDATSTLAQLALTFVTVAPIAAVALAAAFRNVQRDGSLSHY